MEAGFSQIQSHIISAITHHTHKHVYKYICGSDLQYTHLEGSRYFHCLSLDTHTISCLETTYDLKLLEN